MGQSRKSRSKKGCRTCRIRRVKCDEVAPVCGKCSSTGRACEWFDPFQDISAAAKSRSSSRSSSRSVGGAAETPVLYTSPAPIPGAKLLELRGFEFFQLRTAQEISQTFDVGFWQSLVLQLSQSEPAVLHAAVALGTLHETEEGLGMPISKDRVSHSKHRFAVHQYNYAIKLLTDRSDTETLATQDSDVKITVLATCLIFIHIDLLRGYHESAVRHIRSALQILQESSHMLPQSLCKVMRTAFLRLDLQSVHFDQGAPYSPAPMDDIDVAFGPLFKTKITSIAEAKERYDMLLHCTYRLLRTCEANILSHRWDHLEDTCSQLKSMPKTLPTDLEKQGIILLHMQANISLMTVTVCMERDSESAYANHRQEFAEVLSLAKDLQSDTAYPLPTLSTDSGIIFPLAFTVMKCRDWSIRKEALSILQARNYREGFWSTELAATLSCQVAKLEEPYVDGAQSRQTTNVFVDIADDQSQATVSWDWNNAAELAPPVTRSTKSIAI